MLTRSTLSDVVKYAQRTLAECTLFFVRGACRISGNFANFSRDFCAKFASSRRWTRALSCIRTHAESKKSCNEDLRFAQPRWPSSRNFCARGAPKFFGNFEISFARVRRKLCVIPTPDAFFFGSECNADSINSQRRCGVCIAHAGRMHALVVRGACRTSGNFANFSRDFCAKFASSRRWTRAYLAFERTPSRKRAATKICGSRNHAG